MRKSLIATSLLAVTVAMAPACATKKYVRTEVGSVNSKVDTLSGTLEQTQGRIQQDEARIGQVDQKAEAAGQSAHSLAEDAIAMARVRAIDDLLLGGAGERRLQQMLDQQRRGMG